MLQLHTPSPLHPPHDAGFVPPDGGALARWLSLTLDHVGRGMLVLTTGARVLHANRLARQALTGGQVLRIDQGRLRAGSPQDAQALQEALDAAMNRGLRRLLHIGQGAGAWAVAVLPLDAQGEGAALVSLPQAARSQDLAVHGYARQHGFTAAETAVLQALLAGKRPGEIARAKGAQLSTVRTQIGQLRQKCGAHSIRELLDRVAALPPMLSVVQ